MARPMSLVNLGDRGRIPQLDDMGNLNEVGITSYFAKKQIHEELVQYITDEVYQFFA